MQCVALLDEQELEQGVNIAGLVQPSDFLRFLGGKDQIRVKWLCDKIRLQLAALGGKHTNMGGQIIIDLHEPNRDQPVEPGIGDLLQNILVGGGVVGIPLLAPDRVHKTPSLRDRISSQNIRVLRADVIELRRLGRLRKRLCDTLRCDTHQSRTIGNVRNQFPPCPDRKVLDRILVHMLSSIHGRLFSLEFHVYNIAGTQLGLHSSA